MSSQDKEDPFDSAGETPGYISADQARVLAIQHARDNTDFYDPSIRYDPLVWEVVGQEETEDFYEIRLSFRPARGFRGQSGLEQFTIDKMGKIELRQILRYLVREPGSEPTREPVRAEPTTPSGVQEPIRGPVRERVFLETLPFPWRPLIAGVAIVGVVIAIIVVFAVGGGDGSTPETITTETGAEAADPAAAQAAAAAEAAAELAAAQAAGKALVFAYDRWTGSYLPMYVLKVILEEELGYTVTIADQSTIPAAFESVALGRTAIFTSAWFPTRDATLAKHPNLLKLGQAYGGKARDAFEGWMVPADFSEQFNITHVQDLNNPAVARALDIDGDGKGNMIGCPADWVCAKRNHEILADYELAGLYEIDDQSSEEQLLGTIAQRFRQGQPALFYNYQPVAFPSDVPIMDRAIWLDGTQAYLPLAFNRAIVKSDFIVNHPEAARVLIDYRIGGADISWAMGEIAEKGDSPEFLTQLALSWINGHRGEVDSWLVGIREKDRPPSLPTESLTIAYSPEKGDLFLKLAIHFNITRPSGTLPVHPLRRDMADMLDDAVDGGLKESPPLTPSLCKSSWPSISIAIPPASAWWPYIPRREPSGWTTHWCCWRGTGLPSGRDVLSVNSPNG